MDAKLVLVVLAIFVEFAHCQDAQTFCKAFIKCSEDADNVRNQCSDLILIPFPHQNQTSTRSNKNAGKSSGCGWNVRNVSDLLMAAQMKQRQQERDCLKENMKNALLSDVSKSPSECQGMVDAISTDNPATKGDSTSSNASAPNSNTSGNATGPSNSSRSSPVANKNTSYAECMQKSDRMESACRPLSACCSETVTCQYEYELTPLHDQIIQLEYDLFKQYRECRKEAALEAYSTTETPHNATMN